MSLDIVLRDENDEVIAEMNWLRNQFGLCNWAEDNACFIFGKPQEGTERLWYVCNHWAYDASDSVDRALFLNVVKRYWDTLSALDNSFFFFSTSAYRQFIEPNQDKIALDPKWKSSWGTPKWFRGSRYDGQGRLMIPVNEFSNTVFSLGDLVSHERYLEWFSKLLNFAELLQNKNYRFECSN